METEQFITSIGITIVLFFAALLLTSKKYKNCPNNFLAASLITLSLLMLRIHSILSATIFIEVLDFLRIEYLFSVFLYVYVFAVLKERIPKKKLFVLYVPFLFLSLLHSMSEVSGGVFEETVEFIEHFEAFLVIGFNVFVVAAAIVKVSQNAVPANLKKWLYFISSSLIVVMLFFILLEFAELLFDMNLWDSSGFV